MAEILRSKLKLCCSLKHIHQLHGYLIFTGFFNDDSIFSKFIETCSTIGFSVSQYGYSVFKRKTQPSIYLYNTMIKYLSLHQSSAIESLILLKKLRIVGILPDNYTFPFVLRAARRVLDDCVGRQVHGQVIRSGFEVNDHVGIALVQMYSSCWFIGDARQVFDEMRSWNNVALSNAMIAGYAGVGDMDSAREVFGSMRERNVISWTSLISGYVHVMRPREAIEIFHVMVSDGVEVDEVVLLATLSACADLGALELGEWIHGFVDQCVVRKTVPLWNALVDMYVKSGNIEKALQVFEEIPRKSVVSWTTVIVGLAFHGLGREALEMFCRMEKTGIKPNEITFVGIISACGHVGLVELGRSYFNSMSSKYAIKPNIQHYGCMIDLLGRAGRLQEAEDLVRTMPFNANAAIWGSLLAGARTQGNSSLAEKALQQLSILEPNNSGNYSLLSNTYAAIGEWDKARLVRKTMRSSGVTKLAGGSSIEINGCIHSFISGGGGVSAPDAHKILEVPWEINQQCKTECSALNNGDLLLME